MAVKRLQNTHEKAELEWVTNSNLFHKRKHSTAFEFNTIKEISKSYETKHQAKSPKYEQSKPNKCTKKYFHKDHSKINQYYNLEPREWNKTVGLDPTSINLLKKTVN